MNLAEHLRGIVDVLSEAVVLLDRELRVVLANRAFYDLFLVAPGETEGRRVYELGNGQWNRDGMREALERVVSLNEEIRDHRAAYEYPSIGNRAMLVSGRRIRREEWHEDLIFMAIADITDREKKEQEIISIRKLVDNSADIITRFDREGRHVFINKALEGHLGKSNGEIFGKMPVEIGVPPETAAIFQSAFQRILATRKQETVEIPWGDRINQALIVPEFDPSGNVTSFAAYSRDITGMKKVEKELRDSEEKYRTLVEHANDGIIIVQDEIIKYANPRMGELDGSSVDQLVGTPYMAHIDPSEIPKLKEIYRIRMSGKKIPASYEAVLRRKNGDAAPSEVSAALINYRGKPADLVIIHDISEYKRTERELKLKETEFRTLAENSPDIIVRYDRNGRLLYANPRAASLYNLPRAELVDRKSGELGVPAENPHFWQALVQEVFSTRKEKAAEFDYPPGEKYYNAQLVPEFSEDGNVVSVLAISRDITRMKKNEETLRRNEYELRSLSDNSPDLIVRLGRDFRYEYVNNAYERLTGKSREELIGRTNDELGMPSELVENWKHALMKVIESGREYSMEFNITSLFGKRYFATRLIPEYVKSGNVETILAIARDITERVRVEEKLRFVSFHDKVTGLYNRAFFEEEIRRLDTERELPVSIIMGDVNNLKLANDVFGHQEGDALLASMAASIKKACRNNDVVSRWGGDEFAVILPKTDAVVAREICRRIGQNIRENRGTTIVRPSMALGMAVKERGDQNIYQTIRQSEQDMYDNKLSEGPRNEKAVISSLIRLVQERTGDLTGHIDRCAELARRFGRALELDEDQMSVLLHMVEMHDIGMSVVPKSVLTKPGRLSGEEWQLVQKHAEAGFRIVKTFPDTARIADDMLSRGEHWDGSGYPRGLKGKEIPYLARIFAVIEAFDVMSHARRYGRALRRDEAIKELRLNAGTRFDPDLVRAFVGILQQPGIPEAVTP